LRNAAITTSAADGNRYATRSTTRNVAAASSNGSASSSSRHGGRNRNIDAPWIRAMRIVPLSRPLSSL
jgi:hypothetical protein